MTMLFAIALWLAVEAAAIAVMLADRSLKTADETPAVPPTVAAADCLASQVCPSANRTATTTMLRRSM